MNTQIFEQHIVSTPDVRFGKPRIDGTRIAVEDVGVWHDRMGYSVEKIAKDYQLTLGGFMRHSHTTLTISMSSTAKSLRTEH